MKTLILILTGILFSTINVEAQSGISLLAHLETQSSVDAFNYNGTKFFKYAGIS